MHITYGLLIDNNTALVWFSDKNYSLIRKVKDKYVGTGEWEERREKKGNNLGLSKAERVKNEKVQVVRKKKDICKESHAAKRDPLWKVFGL